MSPSMFSFFSSLFSSRYALSDFLPTPSSPPPRLIHRSSLLSISYCMQVKWSHSRRLTNVTRDKISLLRNPLEIEKKVPSVFAQIIKMGFRWSASREDDSQKLSLSHLLLWYSVTGSTHLWGRDSLRMWADGTAEDAWQCRSLLLTRSLQHLSKLGHDTISSIDKIRSGHRVFTATIIQQFLSFRVDRVGYW